MASDKPRSFVFVVVIAICLVLCLMSQEISATSRRLIIRREDVAGGNYNDKISTTHQDDESPLHDYSDYDFYRKHGDVPSPGAGH
ncbi:hypothetical protein K1719_018147 [Acacia pycnantha]|nr:hypothetical protein K1719_018147 [Acacia pycnantha]